MLAKIDLREIQAVIELFSMPVYLRGSTAAKRSAADPNRQPWPWLVHYSSSLEFATICRRCHSRALGRPHRLHQHIAHRRRFVRTDDDRPANCVGRHLREQRVLATAADDVQHIECLAENRFQQSKFSRYASARLSSAAANELAGRLGTGCFVARAKSAIFCSMSPGE